MRRTSFPQNSHRKVLNGDRFAIVAFIASVTIALAALFITLPRPVVLPAFSICALAAAACLALMASLQLRQAGRLLPSAWNLAGAFTLVGCAAAILGEVEAIVEYTRFTPPRSRADD
jgi:hypothetical protein